MFLLFFYSQKKLEDSNVLSKTKRGKKFFTNKAKPSKTPNKAELFRTKKSNVKTVKDGELCN